MSQMATPNDPQVTEDAADVAQFEIGDESDSPGSYEGHFVAHKNGLRIPQGHGTKTVPGEDGWVYTGQFERGLRCGHGSCEFQDGSKYIGDWQADQKHGTGIVTSQDGRRYEGGFAQGKWQGKGVLVLANGSSYDGEWKESKRHGHGVCVRPDGQKYTGQFINDQEHGEGVESLPNGEVYSGGYQQGRRHGRGHLTKDAKEYDMQYELGRESCRIAISGSTAGRTKNDIGISPFVYKFDNGWEGEMLCRMGSVQSMNVLSHLSTNLDSEKLARDMVCFLADSHSRDPNKCSWVESKPSSPWRGRKLLRVPPKHNRVFGQALVNLCKMVQEILKEESPLLRLSTPCLVFGDIHGNFADMEYLSEHLWKMGPRLTPGSFLFLGDYVDRGYNGPEVLAYLLAQKVLAPKKWFLLRGNHELRAVNGDEESYQLGSFLSQCRLRFGDELGKTVWEACNCCFDWMPVAATIGDQLFCVHGGIPRNLSTTSDSRLKDLEELPRPFDPSTVTDVSDPKVDGARKLYMDLLWGDPADQSIDSKLDENGFIFRQAEDNPTDPHTPRHMYYGSKAIDLFFKNHNLNRVLRGHQAKSAGVGVSNGARVLTVFSDSKDHFDHDEAQCGCLLVEDQIKVIIGRPTTAESGPNRQRVVKRKAGF